MSDKVSSEVHPWTYDSDLDLQVLAFVAKKMSKNSFKLNGDLHCLVRM